MLRLDRREIQQAYRYDTPLSYVLCHDCTPEEVRHRLEFVNPPSRSEDVMFCDECKRALHTVTITTWANVMVEYFACKIL